MISHIPRLHVTQECIFVTYRFIDITYSKLIEPFLYEKNPTGEKEFIS